MARFGVRLQAIGRGRQKRDPATGALSRAGLSRNAVAAAAYRTGERLTDFAYRGASWEPPRVRVTTRVSMRPRRAPDAPAPMRAPAASYQAVIGAPAGTSGPALWRAARVREGAADAVIAHEITLNLRPTLPTWDQDALARAAAERLHATLGAAVEVRVSRRRRATSDRDREAVFYVAARATDSTGSVLRFGEPIAPDDDACSRKAAAERLRRIVVAEARATLERAEEGTETFDFTKRRKGIISLDGPGGNRRHLLIGTPARMDLETLFNRAERFADRRDSVVARELVISLPHELARDQQVALARQIAERVHAQLGVAVCLAVHRPKGKARDPKSGELVDYVKGLDGRNVHAHLLFTRAQVDPVTGAFSRRPYVKVRVPGDPPRERWVPERDPATGRCLDAAQELEDRRSGGEWLTRFRRDVEAMTNRALADAGHAERVDARSHAERGILQMPEIHLGPFASRRSAFYWRRFLEGQQPAGATEARFWRAWERKELNLRVLRVQSRLKAREIEFVSLTGMTVDEYRAAPPRLPDAERIAAEHIAAKIVLRRQWLEAAFPSSYRMPWPATGGTRGGARAQPRRSGVATPAPTPEVGGLRRRAR